ncbi:hypothetical protein DL769_004434 [Monosporascus sp. CRB-8-3]|nr:hypothetical protein DL769_004434 [Monosporascus sp. CRB-8-3]
MPRNLVGALSLFVRSLIDIRATIPTNGTMDATDFAAPNGTSVVTNGFSEQFYPVVFLDNYTYWPLSYDDDRYSFAVVVTDNDTNVINSIDAPGARYIDYIVINSINETVDFVGEADETAVLAWDVLSSATMPATTSADTPTGDVMDSTAAETGSNPTNSPSSSPSSSSSSSSPSSSSPPSASSNAGPIAGGVVGGVAFIAIAIAMLLWGRRAWKKHQKKRKDREDRVNDPRDKDGRSVVADVDDNATTLREPITHPLINAWRAGAAGSTQLPESESNVPSGQPVPPESVSGLTGSTAVPR